MTKISRTIPSVLVVLLVAGGCGGNTKFSTTDGDAATDVDDESDVSVDTGADPTVDTAEDPIIDTSLDTTEDPIVDTSLDTTEDPSIDTSVDTAVETLPSCAAFNDACDPGAAQPAGFLCIELPGGTGYCATECDDSVSPDPCPDPAVCYAGYGATMGWCRRDECSGFFGTDCGGSDDCIPVAGAVDICVDSGSEGPGDSCSYHEHCEHGSLCLATGECAAPDCAPLSGTVTCTSPATCQGFMMTDGTPVDLGFCTDDCPPWVSTGPCDVDEWCLPDFYTTGAGMCVDDDGTASRYDPCDGSTPALSCDAGMYCFEPGRCHTLCDPYASGSGPGTCADSFDLCLQLEDGGGTALAVGLCQPTCTFHEGRACAEPSQTCIMGEMLGETYDACTTIAATLDTGEYCAVAGMVEYQLCGGNSFCLDTGVAVQCTDMCVPTGAAPYGTLGHPDCRNSAQTCIDVSYPGFGVCG